MTPERMDNILDESFAAVFGSKWSFHKGGMKADLEQLCGEVARGFGLTLADLQGVKQRPVIAAARRQSVKVMREDCPEVTLSQMAEVLNAKQNTVCKWLREVRNA